MELCRVCMRSHKEMEPIFDNNHQQENDIVTRIQFCTGVLFTKDKKLPTRICKRCLKDLSIAHNFKKNCLDSKSIFENLKLKNVKSEPTVLYNTSNDSQNIVEDLKDNTKKFVNIEIDKVCDVPCIDDSIENNKNCVKDNKNYNNRVENQHAYHKNNWANNVSGSNNLKVPKVKTDPCDVYITSNNKQNIVEDLKDDTENYINIEIERCHIGDDLFRNDSTENDENCLRDDKNSDDLFKSESFNDEDVWPEDVDLNFDDGLLKKVKNEGADSIKNNARRNKSVLLKNNQQNSEIKVKKKRGPYKKSKGNAPHKLKKLKFRRLACEVCQLKFASKMDSDDHKKKFHSSTEKWMCEICGKMMLPASFTYHVRSHLPAKLACDSCNYKSNNKQDLAKHMRIHTNSKAWYICPICAAPYRTSSNLYTHVRMKHNGERRFKCTMCSRAFYDRTKLNRHVDTHNDVRRYCCEVCNSCFTRRCYWKKHLQKEHGIVIPAVRPGRQRAQVKDLRLLEA